LTVPHQAGGRHTILYRPETWRDPNPSAIPHQIFHFFYRIQRAKALTVGHVGYGQLSAPFEPDTMFKFSVSPNAPVALPPLVAAYVEATNSFDLERLMASFAEDV
jgi:hypothetical protein